MAKVVGITCDRCGKFMEEKEIGRIVLTVQTNHGNPADHFDICGNRCLAVVALERAKEEGVLPPGIRYQFSQKKRDISPETRELFAQNAKKMQHGRWHTPDKKGPQEDCEFCLEELTSP